MSELKLRPTKQSIFPRLVKSGGPTRLLLLPLRAENTLLQTWRLFSTRLVAECRGHFPPCWGVRKDSQWFPQDADSTHPYICELNRRRARFRRSTRCLPTDGLRWWQI